MKPNTLTAFPKRDTTGTEAIMSQLRIEILAYPQGYQFLATAIHAKTGIKLSPSCLGALATGRTQWPRPLTLTAVSLFFGYEILLRKKS